MSKICVFLMVMLMAVFVSFTSESTAKSEQQQFKIYLVGASTCAIKKAEARPETGWGEKFQAFFNQNVVVDNRAQNVRSTKSFRNEGYWDKVMDELKPGDWVLIQFGHNDQKIDQPKVGTSIEEYKANLSRYIDETRSKGATPIILTSIVRRAFKEGKLIDTHGDYPKSVIEVATNKKCEYIDMEHKSRMLVASFGVEKSKELYLWASKKEYPNLPNDKKDNTHFSDYGAQRMAGLVVEGIKELKNTALSKALKQ